MCIRDRALLPAGGEGFGAAIERVQRDPLRALRRVCAAVPLPLRTDQAGPGVGGGSGEEVLEGQGGQGASDLSGAEARTWIQGTSRGPFGLETHFLERVSGSSHLLIAAWPSAKE